MTTPAVPISVDPETGIWTTDGLPMLYMPRHFFINNHLVVESALGVEAYAGLLYDSGFKSAYQWCEAEAATHGLRGMEVFHHYLRRLSQRGWAQFDGRGIDPETGCGEVRVSHSCFVEQAGGRAGRKLCYMFAGWFTGALEWVGKDLGHDAKLQAAEEACAGEGHDRCRFAVRPAP